ncbi:MAG: acyl-CoA reductase [Candidatus Hodarchaeales archaeon]
MQTILEQKQDLIQKPLFEIPIVARGRLITDYSNIYGGRHGIARFITPDPQKYLNKIVMSNPQQLKDLHSLGLEEIITFLHDFGERLDLKTNAHLQEAFALGCEASGLTTPVLKSTYDVLPLFFNKQNIREMVDHRIGAQYLDSWVPEQMVDGRTVYVRAFGARAVHIIAGNVPLVAAGTIIRSCVTKSDTIIKLPSNDPLTATAFARTMIEMDPNHPITKHLTVAYWKGGDVEFEERLYRPDKVEKIIAWGGFNSIKHITRYLQPGIDLITLDPKLSTSIIGKEAFKDINTLKKVAQRAAMDVGSYNQEACVNSRVIYVQSGTDAKGIEKLNKLALFLYKSLTNLPKHVSTPAKDFNSELKILIDGLRLDNDFYHVYGGENNEGCVIASQLDEPVDFSMKLCGRVVNLVPIDDLEVATNSMNSYTQTVGVFPEKLKLTLRDDLIMHGVQRIVSLGFAAVGSLATPQDALEPLRRMCKWVVDESSVES